MSFHRTPAEMAADVSFARSGVGESASCHMLWLKPADIAGLGAEPPKTHGRIDFDDPEAVARSREESRVWKEWWGRASLLFNVRQEEARADPVWMAEYVRLLAERRAAAPTEMEALQKGWDDFEAKHPQRGLTDDEQAESTANWAERWRLCREHNALQKRSPKDQRLAVILAAMKICDRRNDELISLSWSRPSYDAEQAARLDLAA